MSAEHICAGGYCGEDRRGLAVFHAMPTVSIGCVMVQPETFAAHYDVSAALSDAKKEAKQIPGSGLFIERRQYHGSGGVQELPSGINAVAPAPTSAKLQPCWAM